MIARFYDKILCGLALLLALGITAVASLWESPGAAAPPAKGMIYTPSPKIASWTKMASWREPPAGRDEWRYDVFTPPVVHYDSRAKKFRVTPIESRETRSPEETAFGLELREVRRTPGRLQLVGYVSGKGGHLGTFENALTGETFLARAGQPLPGLGLTIENFEVRRMGDDHADGMPEYEITAVAVVHDDRTGDDFILTNHQRLLNGAPLAVLVRETGSVEEHTLKEGERLEFPGVVYRVEKIQIDPPLAVVAKEFAGVSIKKNLQLKLNEAASEHAFPLK